jgi:hypothetical protein
MFSIDPAVLGILIPIVAILGGFTVAIVAIIMKGKEEELRRRERIIAMEKGLPLPPEPVPEAKKPNYARTRTWGLVLTFIGIALVVSIMVSSEGSPRHGIWGGVVLALGLALLISATLQKRERDKE